jgi:prepilin-type N-terminal cleavage/methylation domain-containing protein
MKKEGFSLIELLVVIIILGIVASLGTVSFTGWVRKHDLESQVKEMYTDLMNARITAMHQNRNHFISLVDSDGDGFANKITASEDTDGNGTGDSPLCIWNRNRGDPVDASCPNDKSLSYKNLKFQAKWNTPATLTFNTRGLTNTLGTICVFSNHNPSYDCIVISETRIIMGKIKNQSGGCSSANCDKKR